MFGMGKGLILVTGAAGYIGSHTVVELVQSGYDVIGVDNFYNAKPEIIGNIGKIVRDAPGKFFFEKADCTLSGEFSAVFDRYPGIVGAVHFAACKAVNESLHKPLLYYKNNLTALLNLIELMKERAEAANIIFSSSCIVYGEMDGADLPVKETAPLKRPLTPYGKTKQIAEEILSDSVVAHSNLNVCALRYFNPIGAHPSALIGEHPEGVPQNLVPFITQTAAGIRDCLKVFGNDYNTPDGSCVRDYIYVVDLAKAHVKAIEKLLSGEPAAAVQDEGNFSPYKKAERTGRWRVYNIGTGRGLSVLELVRVFTDATGIDLKYEISGRRAGDIEQLWADTSKARAELGWSADSPLDQVLLSAWRWQQTLQDSLAASETVTATEGGAEELPCFSTENH